MKIEIGKTYLTRDGEQVTISGYSSSYPFEGDNGNPYTATGRWIKDRETGYDLIAECSAKPGSITIRVAADTKVNIIREGEKYRPDSDDYIKMRKESNEGSQTLSGTAMALGLVK